VVFLGFLFTGAADRLTRSQHFKGLDLLPSCIKQLLCDGKLVRGEVPIPGHVPGPLCICDHVVKDMSKETCGLFGCLWVDLALGISINYGASDPLVTQQ
jgi:hypothetical protein